jgi:long-subunit fatty acid transport protein
MKLKQTALFLGLALAGNATFADAMLARNNALAANLNVANNNPNNSHFTNPASLMKADKSKGAIVSFGLGVGIKNYKVVKDALDLSDDFDETEDNIDGIKKGFDNIENIVKLYASAIKGGDTPDTVWIKGELDRVTNNLMSAASDVGNVDGLIEDLNANKLGGSLGGNFTVVLPNAYNYPLAFYANNYTDVNVMVDVDAQANKTLKDAQDKLNLVAKELEKFNGAIKDKIDALTLKDLIDSGLLDKDVVESIKEEVKGVEARGMIKAASVSEFGLSMANPVKLPFRGDNLNFNLGYNIKAQRVDIWNYVKNVSNSDSDDLVTDVDDNEVKIGDTHQDSTHLQLDLGIKAALNDKTELGLMINNIRSYKVNTKSIFIQENDENGDPLPEKTEIEDAYKIRTQPIVGLSYKVNDKLTLQGNYALLEGSSFVSEKGNQPLNIGGEYMLNQNWALRAGYNHDTNNKDNKFTGLGFGYTTDSKGFTIDTALQIGSKSTYTGSVQVAFAF